MPRISCPTSKYRDRAGLAAKKLSAKVAEASYFHCETEWRNVLVRTDQFPNLFVKIPGVLCLALRPLLVYVRAVIEGLGWSDLPCFLRHNRCMLVMLKQTKASHSPKVLKGLNRHDVSEGCMSSCY